MNSRTNKTWVEINSRALTNNVRAFKKLLGATKLLAVVKANAYGHGLVEASNIFDKAGADWFGVDSLDEAQILTNYGVKKPILIMGYVPFGQIQNSKFKIQNFGNLRFVGYDLEFLKSLGKVFAVKHPAKVHLKIETGTHRQGILLEDLPRFLKAAQKLEHIEVEGVYSHFASSENWNHEYFTKKQYQHFQRGYHLAEDVLKKSLIKHCVPTAGSLMYPDMRLDMARIGLGLYGIFPSGDVAQFAAKNYSWLKIKPALSWYARIAQIKKVPAGSPIGYDLTATVDSAANIAVLPIGYWDGYDRRFSNNGEVLIAGQRCNVIGRVCMNMIMVDITKLKTQPVRSGNVTLKTNVAKVLDAENGLDPTYIGKRIGTIPWEILSRINPQIPRIVV